MIFKHTSRTGIQGTVLRGQRLDDFLHRIVAGKMKFFKLVRRLLRRWRCYICFNVFLTKFQFISDISSFIDEKVVSCFARISNDVYGGNTLLFFWNSPFTMRKNVLLSARSIFYPCISCVLLYFSQASMNSFFVNSNARLPVFSFQASFLAFNYTQVVTIPTKP